MNGYGDPPYDDWEKKSFHFDIELDTPLFA
jgi:hypothetical protein